MHIWEKLVPIAKSWKIKLSINYKFRCRKINTASRNHRNNEPKFGKYIFKRKQTDTFKNIQIY